MKVIIFEEPGKAAVVERGKPEAGSGEILIKVRYVGFCGSDLGSFTGKNPLVSYPRVPGHEISGEIADLGNGVPHQFTVGEKVTVVPYTSCGECPSCRRNRSHACQFNETMGVQRDGAMQQWISVPWQKVLTAPSLNEQELVLVEPMTVGFHAIDRGEVTDRDTVAVLGCGMIGIGAVVAASQKGSRVIAVDIDDQKLELAREMGARYTLNSQDSDLHEKLSALTRGEGPDVVVEAAGHALTYRAAVDEVAFAGRVVCIGYAGEDVSFATRLFVQKELDIRGSRNATPQDFEAVIASLEQGTIPVDRLITRMVKPDQVQGALEAWVEEPGKVMKILLDLF